MAKRAELARFAVPARFFRACSPWQSQKTMPLDCGRRASPGDADSNRCCGGPGSGEFHDGPGADLGYFCCREMMKSSAQSVFSLFATLPIAPNKRMCVGKWPKNPGIQKFQLADH